MEYDVSKKTVTSIKKYLDDPEAFKFVNEVLQIETGKHQSLPSTIKYLENKFYKAENTVMNSDFSYADNLITWEENMKNIGTFNHEQDGYSYTSLVLVDADLDKHINPTFLFTNCEFGVKKVVSLLVTCELVSVRYE
jgi:uncharacterized glyoxalase superfamily protein PhnB